MTYQDLRLKAGVSGLVRLLGDVYPDTRRVRNFARASHVPEGSLDLADEPDIAWRSLIDKADQRTGCFKLLLDLLLEDMGEAKHWRLPELRAWINSMGVEGIADAASKLNKRYAEFVDLPTDGSLAPAAEPIGVLLVDLARLLADLHYAKAAFGNLPDAERLVRRARDMTRQASAAIDTLVYQVRAFEDFRSQPNYSSSDRGGADRLLGEFALVEHLNRQRAVAGSAVSALLDHLLAIVPREQ